MDLTGPQRFLIEGAPAPELQDYMAAINRKPGALEMYLNKAKKAGFSNVDLKSLIGYAQKKGIIDMARYKFLTGGLELAKTRRHRKTGEFDKRDTALRDTDDDDDDNPGLVTCVRCKKKVDTNKATLVPGQGWRCC